MPSQMDGAAAGSCPQGPSIRLRDVEVRGSDGRFVCLGPMTLEIRAGETIAVVGPSGCGKTTLLRALGGLVALSHGDITFLPSPSPKMALCPQTPSLLPWLTLHQNVALNLSLSRRPEKADTDAVTQIIAAVGLGGRELALPKQVSTGMQTRAALARALVGEPDVLLLDEPTASLDEITAEAILLRMAALLQRSRPTTLLVTHNIAQAASIGDRVVLLDGPPGRPVEVFDNPLSRSRAVDGFRAETAEFADRIRARFRQLR